MAVLFAIVVLPQAVLGYAFGFSLFTLSGFDDPLGLEAFVLLTISLPSWLYFIALDASSRGATLGKRLMGLRVERVGGGRVSLGRAALRTMLKMAPWELTHSTLLVPVPLWGAGALITEGQVIRLAAAYAVMFLYLAALVKSGGTGGIPDLAAQTRVARVEPEVR